MRTNPSFDEVCSALVKEPWGLTLDEVARLNPFQVQHIYFRPEGERHPLSAHRLPPLAPGNNQPETMSAPRPLNQPLKEKELFWRVWKEWRHKSEEEVQALWDQEQAAKLPKK